MTKYIAIIDHNTAFKSGYSHVALQAQTLPEAMTEAEKLLDGTAYLVDIAEKSGRTERRVGGYKETPFTAILRNRGNGWHACDEAHGELAEKWTMTVFNSGATSFWLAIN